LHGAFGAALRDVCCERTVDTPCGDCTLRADCAHAVLWVPLRAAARRLPPGVVHEAPRAVAVAPEPPFLPTHGRRWPVWSGDRVAFRVTLIGGAARFREVVTAALRRVGSLGIGERTAGGHLPMTLRRCRRVPVRSALVSGDEALVLSLLTPVRLRIRGRLSSSLRAADLLDALGRRAETLAALYGRPWRTAFVAERFLADLRWDARTDEVNVPRYSSRQRRWMDWPGLVGQVRIGGPAAAALLPLLTFGEYAQVGKNTSFGFGRYEIRRGPG
jgi:hypothetical protein